MKLLDGHELKVLEQSGNIRLQTRLKDKNGIPVFVGDLIQIPHFATLGDRRVYMFRKVLIVNDKLHAIAIEDLGMIPTADCHKCRVEDCGDFEIIDGPDVNHPVNGEFIRFWERGSLPSWAT